MRGRTATRPPRRRSRAGRGSPAPSSVDRHRRRRSARSSPTMGNGAAVHSSESMQLLRDLRKKMERMEKKEEKKRYDFKSAGLKAQAKHIHQYMDWQTAKLRDELELHFRRLPESLEEVLAQGMLLLSERVQELRVADEYGWAGLATWRKDELARNPEEEKKLHQLKKDKKDREARAAEAKKASLFKNTGKYNTRFIPKFREDWGKQNRRSEEKKRYRSKSLFMQNLEETSSSHREEEEETGPAKRTNALSTTRRGTLPGTITRTKGGPGRDERKKK